MYSAAGSLRIWAGATTVVVTWIAYGGCGAGVGTHRIVDEPRGYSQTRGAPKNTTYTVQAETSQHRLHITVFEQSECDVIKMRLVSRTRETLIDGEVAGREAPTLVQIAEGTQGTVACEKRYATDALVVLRVGDATYRLGRTSAKGELHINIADLLKRSLYKDQGGQAVEAVVLVQARGATETEEAGTVSLAQLETYERRVEELIAEFRPLLEKSQDKLSGQDLTRSYELYEQLDRINAGDARIEALQARFLELLYGRKEEESTASLERNLKALARAKELLAAVARNTAVPVPAFVQVAVQQGDPTDQALRWARGRLALGIRQEPDLCGPPSGQFSWDWLGQQRWSLATQLALALLHYAYNDPYQQQVQSLCARAARW